MEKRNLRHRLACGILALLGTSLSFVPDSNAGFRWWRQSRGCRCNCSNQSQPCVDSNPIFGAPAGGTWYWTRSPEEEKMVAASLFNRYCIRCHGVDGRGVWDIPGIPNFTNDRFQASRSDDQLARAIMQGRGAVMPPFRGVLTLEEAWALARYVRTLVPGTEISRPDDGEPVKSGDHPPPASGQPPTPALPPAAQAPATTPAPVAPPTVPAVPK